MRVGGALRPARIASAAILRKVFDLLAATCAPSDPGPETNALTLLSFDRVAKSVVDGSLTLSHAALARLRREHNLSLSHRDLDLTR